MMTKSLQAYLNGLSEYKYNWVRKYSNHSTRIWFPVICMPFNWHMKQIMYKKEPSLYVEVSKALCYHTQHKLRRQISISLASKQGTVPSYSEAITDLFEKIAERNVATMTNPDLMQLTQLSSRLAAEYFEALQNDAFWCNRECDEYVIKGILLRDCLNLCAIPCVPIGAWNWMLQYLIWGTMNFVIPITTCFLQHRCTRHSTIKGNYAKNTERRSGNDKINNSDSSSSFNWSRKNSSPSLPDFTPIAMQIWH